MKQTAVEWLIDQLQKHYVKQDFENTVVFEQAKQMEKEQIIKFTEDFVENFVFATYDGECLQTKEISEYYNELYEKSL